jgi:SpoVK/Ycf46/Vps4 family AAA+-type ATPase
MNAAEENELHVIVLDEFDAIARRRSSGKGGDMEAGTAARDSVVNQLLALMDGVASLPVPTFVIALTNRRELIDPAVLRPGRCPSLRTTPWHVPSLSLPVLTLAQDASRCKSGWAGRTTTGVRRS